MARNKTPCPDAAQATMAQDHEVDQTSLDQRTHIVDLTLTEEAENQNAVGVVEQLREESEVEGVAEDGV
ncbi:hypothetical protein U1Q18_018025 [Sarracenia purpurea var. burkii]